MLKFLTHKLRTHTLNEDQPHLYKAEDSERDSGTESDDEHCAREDQESMMESEADRWSGSTASPGPHQPTSPTFFVDSALPSDDHHSSEEELEVINSSQPVAVACRASSLTVPEKRKWSQMTTERRPPHAATIAASVSCGNLAAPPSLLAAPAPPPQPASSATAASLDHSCTSSDEEVQGLLSTPVQFRTSPPLDAHKPGRSLSPPPKLFHLCSAVDVSPRKRHRHTPRPRPCLDFEKMQQLKARSVTAWRHGGDHSAGERSVFCW